MGINVSRAFSELDKNECLEKFVGKQNIPFEDREFWITLLQFRIHVPSNAQEQLSFDSHLETLCQQFCVNNLNSGNFGTLLTIFSEEVSKILELSDNESSKSVHVWQSYNSLFIIRTLIKYMIETGFNSEYQLLQHFETMPAEISSNEAKTSQTIDIEQSVKVSSVNKNIDGTKFQSFFDAIINILVVIPVKDFTYHLHLEAINTIIVLLSINLFSQQSTEKSTIYKTIYKNQYANTLMGALLHFVSRMHPAPAFSTGGSFVFGIAESLWSILTFSRKQPDLMETSDLQTLKEQYPLANQSLLLILILTNHWTTGNNNLYRNSLFMCGDSKDSSKDPISFRIDFSSLYGTLCRIVSIDQATLLLYLLLHRNEKFNRYIMAQDNLQQMVIPILQILYNAPNSTSHHIYMSLIVLLILSEDDGFIKSVHQINLKNVQWYTERSISEISLGGLLVLVVIRTIQFNMLKMRDRYLHTNCLAALANMSGQFRSLHPYVAQRLVSLFEILAKKHSRLDTQMNNGETTTLNVSVNSDDMLQDLSVLEEVLRMVLEILNSALSHQLVYCPNLVYTLLYKKQVFENFRSHAAFQDIIQNIDMVVGFFSSRLQRVQDQNGELSVNEVLEVISKGASQWSSDRLRKFPDLKFKYVEEEAPEEFFIPYIWSLVCKHGCVHFSSEKSIKNVTTDVNC